VASPVSAPVSTTVIAFDIAGADSLEGGTRGSFDKVVAAARGLGFVTQDAGKPNLTLTLAPDAPVAEALSRIAAVIAEFNGAAAPLRVRAISHYGVVFRVEDGGQVSFSGSASRSTQSALRRAPDSGSLMATRDFAALASKFAGLPFHFEAMNDAAGAEGLSHIVIGTKGVVQGALGNALPGSDPAFVAFVKRRLATDIGPFAGALVDRALQSTMEAGQMVKALSREIENPVARAAFEQEGFRFIKAQSKN
jgi:hypothetical protein